MAFSFDLAVIFERERRMKRRSTVTMRGRRRRRRRRRDMCKSHKEQLPEIPFDLVIEILTRLPAKSLMRFKSVSKLWSVLICSQSFTNLFPKVPSPQRLRMWLVINNKKVILLASSPDSDVSSFLVDQELTMPMNLKGYHLSHDFHGLMCFAKEPRAKIYNTTTRQLFDLPDIEESNILAEDHAFKKVVYHIGYVPVHNQYKVVCTVSRPTDEFGGKGFMSEHWVFRLGGGDRSNRWRKIPLPSHCPPHVPLTPVLNINGRMHYLAWVRILDSVLVSFDINSEEISMLELPANNFWPRTTNLIDYGGKVALLRHGDLKWEGVVELWIVEDSTKNTWSSKTLVLHPSQRHLVDSFEVQGTTTSGEVVLVPQNYTYTPTGHVIIEPQNTTLFYVLLYNLQNNHMRKVEIIETSGRYLTKDWDVGGLEDCENLMYL